MIDVVGMAGAVNVSIVTALDLLAVLTGTILGLILYVSGVDGDTTLSLLGSLIDVCIVLELCKALEGKILGDSCSKSGFTMVNVADGTNVYMGLGSVKMFLCHWNILLRILEIYPIKMIFNVT